MDGVRDDLHALAKRVEALEERLKPVPLVFNQKTGERMSGCGYQTSITEMRTEELEKERDQWKAKYEELEQDQEETQAAYEAEKRRAEGALEARAEMKVRAEKAEAELERNEELQITISAQHRKITDLRALCREGALAMGGGFDQETTDKVYRNLREAGVEAQP